MANINRLRAHMAEVRGSKVRPSVRLFVSASSRPRLFQEDWRCSNYSESGLLAICRLEMRALFVVLLYVVVRW